MMPRRSPQGWRARTSTGRVVALGLLLAAAPAPALGATPEGFGASTPGGAGGAIVRVTTLADSGPGSLRAALAGGDRTIVFDVAGEILLQNHLHVRGAFVTIDGFSAPAPGITLRNGALVIRGSEGAHDVIVRGLRIRGSPLDNLSIAYGAYNVVVSHVSLSGAGDGNLDITEQSRDVTVAWSIIAAPASNKSMLIKYDPARVTLHHNLFVDSPSRNPSASIDDAGTPAADTTLDMRNNVVWNWSGGYGTLIHHGARANVVGNFYSSPASGPADQAEALVVCKGGDCFGGDPTSGARGYVAGNLGGDPLAFDLNAVGTESEPFPAPAVTTTDACQAAHDVAAGVGPRPLDAVDAAYVAAVALPACASPATATTVQAAPSPSRFGQTVAVTATVTSQTAGAGTPTGSVTFLDGGTPLATVALADGIASHDTSGLAVGTHALAAAYSGDARFDPSGSVALAHVVSRAATAIGLVSSKNPSKEGQAVTFIATVTTEPGAGTATGEVTFYDGTTHMGTAVLSGGQASYTTGALALGDHAITAAYGGNATLDASLSEPLAQAVRASAGGGGKGNGKN